MPALNCYHFGKFVRSALPRLSVIFTTPPVESSRVELLVTGTSTLIDGPGALFPRHLMRWIVKYKVNQAS
jgi:hypothetical protein